MHPRKVDQIEATWKEGENAGRNGVAGVRVQLVSGTSLRPWAEAEVGRAPKTDLVFLCTPIKRMCAETELQKNCDLNCLLRHADQDSSGEVSSAPSGGSGRRGCTL